MPKRFSRRSNNQRRRRSRRSRNYRGGDIRICPKCNKRSFVCDSYGGVASCNCSECGYYEN